MAFQESDFLVLAGLSILDDPRPSNLQPVFDDGVYLRWAFGSKRAFPLHGYHLFRRAYGEPGRHCLAGYLEPFALGPQPGELLTAYGRLHASPGPVVLIDAFAPGGAAELDLRDQRAVQVDLPPGVVASKVTARLGFFPRPEPESRRTEVDFRPQPAGTGPNPRVEQEIRFEVFRAPGSRAAATQIHTGVNGGGLECSRQLVITLPQPAWRINLLFHRPWQQPPLKVKALNQDGSVAQELSFTANVIGTFLEGTAITRVEVDAPLELALLHLLVVDSLTPPSPIRLNLLRRGRTIATAEVTGEPGEVVTKELLGEGADTVSLSGGPAALIDLCYWVTASTAPLQADADTGAEAAASSQPGPWTKVRGYPYPLTLPITHPSYPASAGTEALSTRRAEAARRIRYGSAADALPAQPRTPGPGTITIRQGSALVKGKGTNWDTSLVGQMLFLRTLDTAYAVMAVLAPDRLVLSRAYRGFSFEDFPYELATEDVFAQVHDQIGAVLENPGAMRAATMPPVLEQSRRGQWVVLPGEAPPEKTKVVVGNRTSWTRDLEGLLLEVGPNRVYRIVTVDPAKQEITLHAEYEGPEGPSSYRILSRSPDNRIESGPSLQIRPLDLLELASLDPAFAQLLGLSWIDASAERDETYDYMLLADHGGRFNRDGNAALLWLNGSPDWTGEEGVDGALLTGIQHIGSEALAAPSFLQVFALPAGRSRQTPERPDLADTEPGLSIRDLVRWPSLSPAQRPLRLDVWRISHGPQPPPAIPPGPGAYERIDSFMPGPIRRDPAQASPRPPGWPDPASIHFIDSGTGGLDIGWYSYLMSAVDFWGRYSALSPPIPWHDVADGHQLHPWAVHLEDRTPPPPPTDVMAWILEPNSVNDPMRVVDAAYTAWRAKVGPGVVGLRVSWRWSWSHELRAPDLSEFRVYAQPKPLNARFHRIVSVVPMPGDSTRSLVKLAAADSLASDAYAGAILQVKERGYPIEGSHGGASLELRVKNGGPTGREAPPAGTDATIVLLPEQALHRNVTEQALHRKVSEQTLHRNVTDPRHWERWIGAVPANAALRFDIDVMEDPDVVLYDEPANPLHGAAAVWNQPRIRLADLPPDVPLTNVRPGIDVIALASDTTGVFARLDIASVGPGPRQIVPAAAPAGLEPGTYRWAIGPTDRGLRGTGARWTAATRTLDLLPSPKIGRVRPGSDRIYLRVTPASTSANLRHFFEIESVDATQGRLVLAGAIRLLTDGQAYDWRIGTPLRIYEAFFPSQNVDGPDDPQIAKEWLKPSLPEPVVYGTIGVSAADKRTEVVDVRPGRMRPGNEGLLGNPATVFRVYRAKPDTPADGAWDAEKLQATRADYHGKSYFTVRWPKPGPVKRQHFKALIFRASEETLFQVDMEQKEQTRTFPLTFTANDPRPSHWSETRKADVAKTLFDVGSDYATLRALPTPEKKLEKYRQLSDDALSVLANLPGNSEAFSQITIEPLDLTSPANDDRRGPDDPTGFPPPKPTTTNAWLDTLPGLVQNRYLYKIAYVDSAQNRGPLSKASPPVYLPKVVSPRTPVITKIVGGDRQITIHWAANREPDLAGYRVYRTEDKEKARDVRLMDKVSDVEAAKVEYVDRVPALVTFYYRLTALDTASNESAATASAAGRAFQNTPPEPPVWNAVEWTNKGPQPVVSLSWKANDSDLRCVLQRRDASRGTWVSLSDNVIPSKPHEWQFDDASAKVGMPYEYRVRVFDAAGNSNLAYNEYFLPAVLVRGPV